MPSLNWADFQHQVNVFVIERRLDLTSKDDSRAVISGVFWVLEHPPKFQTKISQASFLLCVGVAVAAKAILH